MYPKFSQSEILVKSKTTRATWPKRYVSHHFPELKSVAILVLNEHSSCMPISVYYIKWVYQKKLCLLLRENLLCNSFQSVRIHFLPHLESFM